MIGKHIEFEVNKDFIIFEVLRFKYLYINYENKVNELLEYRYNDNKLRDYISGIKNGTILELDCYREYINCFEDFLNDPNEDNYNKLITQLNNYKENEKHHDVVNMIDSMVIRAIDMTYEKEGKNNV